MSTLLFNECKLDNPAWFALSETHGPFEINYSGTKFYHPDYCPFGGFEPGADTVTAIDNYAGIIPDFFIVGGRPAHSAKVSILQELVCLQMIIKKGIEPVGTESIVPLTGNHTAALTELVTLVQPGYFKQKTALLGNYYGIFTNGRLVAVTGERMRMNGFTEISAVVTHPEHTGKGYARQLLGHCVNNILAMGHTPFLHVTNSNAAAIRLYEKAGFITRRSISFWHIAVPK